MKKNIVLIIVLIFKVDIYPQEDIFEPKTVLGGYGELHYNYEKIEKKQSNNILDFHRFVLFISHSWSEKWSFKAELELEHNYVFDKLGELELEQAYVNYHYADWLGLKFGVVLPSVGLLNDYHEPPLFLSVERPEYHNKIIPTTWFGNGVSIYGNYRGFKYSLTIMEGLNADKFSASNGIRGGRQKGYKAKADNLLYNMGIDFINVKDLLFGASLTYNNAFSDSLNNRVLLLETHLKYSSRRLIIVAEYGQINFEKGKVKTSSGYYVELGYNLGDFLGYSTKIIPFIRYTNYNTAASVRAADFFDNSYHVSKWMVGLSFKPIDEVVFKIDMSQKSYVRDEIKSNFFNLGIGYMF